MYSDVVMEKAEGIDTAEGQGIRHQLERDEVARHRDEEPNLRFRAARVHRRHRDPAGRIPARGLAQRAVAIRESRLAQDGCLHDRPAGVAEFVGSRRAPVHEQRRRLLPDAERGVRDQLLDECSRIRKCAVA